MLLFALMNFPTPAAAEENPLLAPWPGPHGGVPPFDKVKPELLGPALEHSMELYRQDIRRIAEESKEPDFHNTIVALESAGKEFDRVSRLFEVFASTMNGPEIKDLEREWSPKFSALYDEIIQNQALFSRIAAVYRQREQLNLGSQESRLLWLTYNRFVKSGAELSSFEKKKLAQINARLATLYTEFGQNLLADEETQKVVFNCAEELTGLPESAKEAAAREALEMGLSGKWVIRNTRSSAEPFLTYVEKGESRRKVWQMWVSRGDGGGETDNNAVVSEILKLRARRAKMLGFPTHAHWQLSDAMAKTPEAAMDLMLKVWKPAVARVAEEVADMQKVAAERSEDTKIEPWDYRFYAEKVRRKKYDLDEARLKPYLQLDNLLQAQFWVAHELFGMAFRETENMPVYHPDVRVFEVTDKEHEHLGYWYYDPYARDGKRSGAWMSEYRTQEAISGAVSPIVSNNSNYLKGRSGEPVLISWDDAETMFHEFGHALHGLLSKVTYPTLAGTNVARDFVEFPSQLTEHWLSTPEVLNRFALHYQTGESMPMELMERIERAATFNQGFSTVEFLASALVDMKLHLSTDEEIDAREFERETLRTLEMPESIVMRHRIPQFAHIFSGDYYSAAYYSYLWAEVLDQDAWNAFRESEEGPFSKTLAERLLKCVLSAGNTQEPAEAYRAFRGHDPSIRPLLEARGFPVE